MTISRLLDRRRNCRCCDARCRSCRRFISSPTCRTEASREGGSATGFCLRYVTPDLFDFGADNGADETAAAIVNVNLRNRADVVLPRHRRVHINDVDLAQCNLRIGACHLLQAWRALSARAAPVRIKIDNGHVAEGKMSV